MDSQSNSTHFDVLVLGTGLNESLVAAAHARRGDTVLHIDPNDYYGGTWAGMDWNRFKSLGGQVEGFSDFEHLPGPAADSLSTGVSEHAHRFAIELAPKLLYARGALVDLFSQTGAGRHLDFKLVEGTFISSPPVAAPTGEGMSAGVLGTTDRVPASKEDVFASKSISLIDKRRLMKFFTNEMAAVEGVEEAPAGASFADYLRSHEIKGQLESVLAHGVALLAQPNVPAHEGAASVRKYLDSLGRFGNSPFLACMYGGGGEIAQSLCRVAAVYGGVYILGRPVAPLAFDHDRRVWTVSINGDMTFTANKLVANCYTMRSLVPLVATPDEGGHPKTFHAIVLTNQGVRQDTQLGLYIVPPKAATGTAGADHLYPASAVQVVELGSEMHVCPKGIHVLHFRGTSRADVQIAVERLLRTDSIVHTSHFAHVAKGPRLQLSDELRTATFLVPSVTMALDVDADVAPVMEAWTREVGQDDFLAPLPNPDEQQMVNEARQLQEQQQTESGADQGQKANSETN